MSTASYHRALGAVGPAGRETADAGYSNHMWCSRISCMIPVPGARTSQVKTSLAPCFLEGSYRCAGQPAFLRVTSCSARLAGEAGSGKAGRRPLSKPQAKGSLTVPAPQLSPGSGPASFRHNTASPSVFSKQSTGRYPQSAQKILQSFFGSFNTNVYFSKKERTYSSTLLSLSHLEQSQIS